MTAQQPSKKKIKLLIDKENLDRALHATQKNQQTLTQIVSTARQEILNSAHDNLLQKFYQGTQCAEEIARAVDVLMTSLFTYISQEVFPRPNPTKAERLTLLAIGGYGQGKLAPFSDIDLLFLLPGKNTQWGEQTIELMLKILWDSEFKIGHSVFNVKQIPKRAKEDLVFCTSLLNIKHLSGDEELFLTLKKQIEKTKKIIGVRTFVKAKLTERDIRHEKEGRSRFLVEPNIKNGKGGLRDLQTLWWLVKFCYGEDSNIFSKEANQKLSACENFLWEVRCYLHFLCGAPQEKLSFQHQQALTQAMNFLNPNVGEEQTIEALEKFMKNYFLVAKEAGSLTRILCAELEAQQAKPQPRISRLIKKITKTTKDIQLTEDFLLERGRLKATTENLFTQKPLMILRYFELAALHRVNFHPSSLNQIRNALPHLPKTLRLDKNANEMFLNILAKHPDPARILRTMNETGNETGFLGWFIPAFGNIVAQMQFNRYHHYTVDEHIIHAVELLDHLEQAGIKEINRARLLARRLAKQNLRAVLYIAIFTHDIAKGQKGDHSQRGAEVCYALATRLGLTEENAHLAAWLVENHLLMSDCAQKRDLNDDKTIKNFVKKIQTIERLKLLFLLTIVDIQAVGPGTWNGWKAQLLNKLYELAFAELKTPFRIQHAQKARRQRRKLAARLTWSEKEKRAYLKLHKNTYWNHTSEQTQKTHALLWETWREKTPFAFHVKNSESQAHSEMTIITPDHPGLFSRIVGAIVINKGIITDARIFTSDNGLAFDSFWIQNQNQAPLDETHSQRLKATIEKVLLGKLLPYEEITKKQNVIASKENVFNIKPKIILDNELSDECSVIEVECLNNPYLIYATAQKMFREGLILSSAHITTYGERAVNVFYVKDTFSQKITDKEKQTYLKNELLKVCAQLGDKAISNKLPQKQAVEA